MEPGEKDATRANKTVATKAWLQNKAELHSHARYAEEQTFGAQSWKNARHNLDSNYWQANKVFWQTIRCLRAKNLILLDLTKTILSYSALRRASLADGAGGVPRRWQKGHNGQGAESLGSGEKFQHCHKYFLQCSTHVPRGGQVCFLPRAPSNLNAPLRWRKHFKDLKLSHFHTISHTGCTFGEVK